MLNVRQNVETDLIEGLENDLHEVIVSSGIQVSYMLTAVTSILCQMIAALPEEARRQALATSLEGLVMGVDIFSETPDENRFALGKHTLNH
jgi:hypothetical protein